MNPKNIKGRFKKGNTIGSEYRFKKGHKHSEETKRKIIGTGRHHSKETKMKMTGRNNPAYGKKPQGGKRGYYKGILMRSSWEIKIASLLDKAKIKWLYEPKRFYLKNLTYCPDFYLPKWDLWIEIKGWLNPENKKRLRQFRGFYPKENLLIIDKYLYKKIINYEIRRTGN